MTESQWADVPSLRQLKPNVLSHEFNFIIPNFIRWAALGT